MGLKVKLNKSLAGAAKDQLGTLTGLGLTRFGEVRVLRDTPSIRGMIFKVKHLVGFEVVKEEAPTPNRRKPAKIIRRDRDRANIPQP